MTQLSEIFAKFQAFPGHISSKHQSLLIRLIEILLDLPFPKLTQANFLSTKLLTSIFFFH